MTYSVLAQPAKISRLFTWAELDINMYLLEAQMSIKFVVTLPTKRDGLGELMVFDTITSAAVLGPFPCLGTAVSSAARENGNDALEMTKNYGHTPDGGYDVVGTIGPDPVGSANRRSYGPNARFKLVGVSGAAQLRQANIDARGEKPLRIHGGHQEQGPYKPSPGEVGGFVKTYGCLRMADGDIAALLSYIQDNGITYSLSMEVRSGVVQVVGVLFDGDDVDVDPGE